MDYNYLYRRARMDVVYHYRGYTLRLAQGDLTKYKVDCVVSPANSHMVHTGGLAGRLLTADGPKMAQDTERLRMEMFPRSNGVVDVGRCLITKTHRLSTFCKYIVHAVGPNCNKLQENMDRFTLTYMATSEALRLAESMGDCRSIAIPAIGRSNFRMKPTESTGVIVTAVKNFLDETQRNIREVHFVERNDRTLQQFQVAVQEWILPDDIPVQKEESPPPPSKTVRLKVGVTPSEKIIPLDGKKSRSGTKLKKKKSKSKSKLDLRQKAEVVDAPVPVKEKQRRRCRRCSPGKRPTPRSPEELPALKRDYIPPIFAPPIKPQSLKSPRRRPRSTKHVSMAPTVKSTASAYTTYGRPSTASAYTTYGRPSTASAYTAPGRPSTASALESTAPGRLSTAPGRLSTASASEYTAPGLRSRAPTRVSTAPGLLSTTSARASTTPTSERKSITIQETPRPSSRSKSKDVTILSPTSDARSDIHDNQTQDSRRPFSRRMSSFLRRKSMPLVSPLHCLPPMSPEEIESLKKTGSLPCEPPVRSTDSLSSQSSELELSVAPARPASSGEPSQIEDDTDHFLIRGPDGEMVSPTSLKPRRPKTPKPVLPPPKQVEWIPPKYRAPSPTVQPVIVPPSVIQMKEIIPRPKEMKFVVLKRKEQEKIQLPYLHRIPRITPVGPQEHRNPSLIQKLPPIVSVSDESLHSRGLDTATSSYFTRTHTPPASSTQRPCTSDKDVRSCQPKRKCRKPKCTQTSLKRLHQDMMEEQRINQMKHAEDLKERRLTRRQELDRRYTMVLPKEIIDDLYLHKASTDHKGLYFGKMRPNKVYPLWHMGEKRPTANVFYYLNQNTNNNSDNMDDGLEKDFNSNNPKKPDNPKPSERTARHSTTSGAARHSIASGAPPDRAPRHSTGGAMTRVPVPLSPAKNTRGSTTSTHSALSDRGSITFNPSWTPSFLTDPSQTPEINIERRATHVASHVVAERRMNYDPEAPGLSPPPPQDSRVLEVERRPHSPTDPSNVRTHDDRTRAKKGPRKSIN